MPLFRRQPRPAEPVSFGVGVDGHVVVVGSPDPGCHLLGELEEYVSMVSRRMPASGGRDSIAVQNAKMDYAELSDAAATVVALAVEELIEQELLAAGDVPSKPHHPPLDEHLSTYEYIQVSYQRAETRVNWIRAVDGVLRERGIAVLKPPPAG